MTTHWYLDTIKHITGKLQDYLGKPGLPIHKHQLSEYNHMDKVLEKDTFFSLGNLC